MAHETILIVEDEKDILNLIAYNLEKEGYRTIAAETGESALSLARKSDPDLILLDLMLPGLDGFEVCRSLKAEASSSDVPILMLTAKSEDADIVSGLEMGADDYMTKPFSPKVLVARIGAVLRRARHRNKTVRNNKLNVHDIEIDISKHEVHCGGGHIPLSVSEFLILAFLARNPGWVFSRNQIITAVKGEDYPVTERSVDVQILGLRRKLGSYGSYIQTVRGIGYRMQDIRE